MKLTKTQRNFYAWIALIVLAIAIFMPGDSGRQVFGREAQVELRTSCGSLTEAVLAGQADQGLTCAHFLLKFDTIFTVEKKITLKEAKTTYSSRTCDLKCYDCSTDQTPVGQIVCQTGEDDQNPSGITGAPPGGSVTFSNGDDWISAKITIHNSLSDPISGIVSLEIETEEEIAARAGFGASFNCENKEDIQKTFTLAAGRTEVTTLTSTGLEKGEYVAKVVSLDKCCKYGCEAIAPFEFGDAYQRTYDLLGKQVPTYSCSTEGGKCKSSPNEGDKKIVASCPTGQSCYKKPLLGNVFGGFSSVTDWWEDRTGLQKMLFIVGGFTLIAFTMLLFNREQQP